MNNNQETFRQMETKLYDFAENIFFENETFEDLLMVKEQKELLHLKMTEVEKLQDIHQTIKGFCEPQVKMILEVAKHPDEMKKSDFELVKNQAHQLVQNYENLEKIIKYVEVIDKKQNKKFTKEWQEAKAKLATMDVNSIKNIEVEASNLC